MTGYIISHERRNSVDPDYQQFMILHKSNHSYAINRKITEVLKEDAWLGQRCFIIGGGESLKGFDFNRLNNEKTIGINKAFYSYPNLKINYSMDTEFYRMLKQGRYEKPNQKSYLDTWMSFNGIKSFVTPMELQEFGKEVYLIRRIFHPSVSRSLEGGIYPGRNSGLGAMMLAIALGVSEIYLLGYDMKAETSSHWHEGYGKDLVDFRAKLDEYRKEIEELKPMMDIATVKVYNLNPNSALKCFEFKSIDEVLK